MGLLPESGLTPHPITPGPGESTGALTQLYQANKKLNRTVDVVADFGCVLDGVTVNDTAFAAALAAGKRLFIPAGTLLLSTALSLPAGTQIFGDPTAESVIKIANGNNPAVIYSQSPNIRLSDLVFDGGTQTANTKSVLFDGVVGGIIERCRFRNMQSAVWLNDGHGPCKRIRIVDCYFEPCKDYAIWCSGGADDVYIARNTIENVTNGGYLTNGQTAIRYNGRTGTITGNNILGSADTGVMLTGPSFDTIISDNRIHSTYVGVFAGTGAQRFRITGNRVQSDSDFGIACQDAASGSDGVINANHIIDCGKSGISIDGMEGVVISGNLIQRVGKALSTLAEERCGILISNRPAGGQPSKNIAIVGNVINDRYGTGSMEIGILNETAGPSIAVWGNSVTGATVANYAVLAPTAAPGANAGTGATTPAVVGTNESGVVGLNTGTGATAGTLATVTFTVPYDVNSAPIAVMLTPANPAAAAAVGSVFTTLTTSGGAVTGFNVIGTPVSSTGYYWVYQVITNETTL